MLQNFRVNIKGFTKREGGKARLSCKAQSMLGSTYEKYLLVVSNSTGIANCPMSPTDITYHLWT